MLFAKDLTTIYIIALTHKHTNTRTRAHAHTHTLAHCRQSEKVHSNEYTQFTNTFVSDTNDVIILDRTILVVFSTRDSCES